MSQRVVELIREISVYGRSHPIQLDKLTPKMRAQLNAMAIIAWHHNIEGLTVFTNSSRTETPANCTVSYTYA